VAGSFLEYPVQILGGPLRIPHQFVQPRTNFVQAPVLAIQREGSVEGPPQIRHLPLQPIRQFLLLGRPIGDLRLDFRPFLSLGPLESLAEFSYFARKTISLGRAGLDPIDRRREFPSLGGQPVLENETKQRENGSSPPQE